MGESEGNSLVDNGLGMFPAGDIVEHSGAVDPFMCMVTESGFLAGFKFYPGFALDGGGYFESVAKDFAGNLYFTGHVAPVGGAPTELVLFKESPTFATAFYEDYYTASDFAVGQTGEALGESIRVDAAGEPYVGGLADTIGIPPPYTEDCLVAKFSPTGAILSALDFGGSDYDVAFAIDISPDHTPSVYATGLTHSTDFTVSPGAAQATYNGGSYDAFVSAITGL
jgi:hypothetical protein